MAKYTVTVATLLAAHANLYDRTTNERKLTISEYIDGVVNTQPCDYTIGDFTYLHANELVTKYAREFFDRHLGDLKENITNKDDLNDAIYTQFCQNFVRHFYGYEIGQENPEHWFVLLREFLGAHLPIWYQGYQKLFIDNAQWITNDNDSHSLTVTKNTTKQDNTNASIAGRADTPQNELDFKMNTGDPTDDYNFRFASEVSGSKGKDNTQANSDGNSDTTTHTQGRNSTITDLLNTMLAYSDGIYFDLFSKAKFYGLFMQVY